jgi:sugar lactone lactonase YvrE
MSQRKAIMVVAVLVTVVGAVAAILTATAGGHRRPTRHRTSHAEPEMLTNPNVCIPGTGAEGWCGDGTSATSAKLFQPQGVGALPHGGFLIADSGNNVIRDVNVNGVIATVAGFGNTRAERNAKTAKAVALSGPGGIAVLPHGGYLIADTGDHRVLRVDPDGRVVIIAGTGADTSAGDGGPARRASLMSPEGLAVEPDGAILIADPAANRVRRIVPNGKIETFAGTGRSGFSGDGGSNAHAQLAYPTGVAVEANGDVLIADNGNFRIRSVAPDGIITTVAGGAGQPAGSSGGTSTTGASTSTTSSTTSPGGASTSGTGTSTTSTTGTSTTGIINTPGAAGLTGAGTTGGTFASATGLQLNGPSGVAAMPDGGFVIADGPVVEEVRADGSAVVIGGDGSTSPAVADGPATSTALGDASAVAVAADGSILVADYATDRIREIAKGQLRTIAGSGSPQPVTVTVGSYRCPDVHYGGRTWEQFGTLPSVTALRSRVKHHVGITILTSIRAEVRIEIFRGDGGRDDTWNKSVARGEPHATLPSLPAVGTYKVHLTGRSAIGSATICSDTTLHNIG